MNFLIDAADKSLTDAASTRDVMTKEPSIYFFNISLQIIVFFLRPFGKSFQGLKIPIKVVIHPILKT